jgi:hypothetical protein
MKVRSAGVIPVGKLTSIIAGMACGADCIDDLGAVGSGAMKRRFTGVCAGVTLGQFRRELFHYHVNDHITAGMLTRYQVTR